MNNKSVIEIIIKRNLLSGWFCMHSFVHLQYWNASVTVFCTECLGHFNLYWALLVFACRQFKWLSKCPEASQLYDFVHVQSFWRFLVKNSLSLFNLSQGIRDDYMHCSRGSLLYPFHSAQKAHQHPLTSGFCSNANVCNQDLLLDPAVVTGIDQLQLASALI